MSRSMWAGVAVALSVCLPAAAASADEADIQRAKVLVELGAGWFRDGKFDEAFEAFSKAHTALPDRPRLLWNMGRCKEELGKTEEALLLFEQYLNVEAADRAGIKEALQKVAALRAKLRPDLATVRIEAAPGGAALTLDGEPVGTAPLTLEVPPGEHTVEARAEGYRPASVSVKAEVGVASSVSLALSPLPKPDPKPAQAVAPPPPPPEPSVRLRPFLAGAAAVLATALSVGAFLDATDKDDEADLLDARGAVGMIAAGDATMRAGDARDDARLRTTLGWTFAASAVGTLAFSVWDLLAGGARSP